MEEIETIHFDGTLSAGEMHGLVLIRGEQFVHAFGGGGTSSTQAEWLTAVEALRLALRFRFRRVLLIGDSKNQIYGATGRYKKLNHVSSQQRDIARSLESKLCVRWEWKPRDENPAGRLLAKMVESKTLPLPKP